MPFDVKMPDGTTIKNVPDGTSKEAFMAKYKANTQPAAAPPTPIAQAPAATPQQPPANAGDSTFSKSLQAGGQGADMVNNAVGGVAKAAYGAIPEGAFKQSLQAAGRGAQQVAGAVSGAIPDVVKQKAAQLMQEHPEATRDLGAIAKMASVAPVGKVAGSAAKLAGEATAITPIAKGIMSPSVEALKKSTAMLDATAQNTVRDLKNAGVSFHPGVGGKIVNELERVTSGIKDEAANRAKPALDKIKDAVEQIKGGNNDLSNLFYLQKSLKEITQQGGDAAPVASAAVKKIDRVLSAPGIDKLVVSGDPKSAGLISKFNKEYAMAKNHETLVDVLDAGEGKPALSSSQVRAKLSKLVDSDSFKYFSPEIKDQIKAAARGKTSEKILSGVGKLKYLLGASLHSGAPLLEAGLAVGTGNVPVAAGIAGVMGAGAAAKQITKGSVADILQAIQAGK